MRERTDPIGRLAARSVWTEVGCLEWQGGRNPKGYAKISDIFGRPQMAHRLVWESEHGPIPVGLMVCHRCDNPPCVNPAHLFLGSAKDNTQDMISKGRGVAPTGLANGKAKLSDEQVRQIHSLRASGRLIREISAQMGVSDCHVGQILRGNRRAAVRMLDEVGEMS